MFEENIYENKWWINPGVKQDLKDRQGNLTGWKLIAFKIIG